MPQLLGFAILAVGGLILMRAMRAQMDRVEKHLSRAANPARKAEARQSLERDPVTGRYRPK